MLALGGMCTVKFSTILLYDASNTTFIGYLYRDELLVVIAFEARANDAFDDRLIVFSAKHGCIGSIFLGEVRPVQPVQATS